MAEVVVEAGVVVEKVVAAGGEVGVEAGAHAVGIGRDGALYVVPLPIHGGVGVDALLLVEKAVGRVDAVGGDGGHAISCCSPRGGIAVGVRCIRSRCGGAATSRPQGRG